MTTIDRLEELSSDIDDAAFNTTRFLDDLRDDVTSSNLELAESYLNDLVAKTNQAIDLVRQLGPKSGKGLS